MNRSIFATWFSLFTTRQHLILMHQAEEAAALALLLPAYHAWFSTLIQALDRIVASWSAASLGSAQCGYCKKWAFSGPCLSAQSEFLANNNTDRQAYPLTSYKKWLENNRLMLVQPRYSKILSSEYSKTFTEHAKSMKN